MSDILRLLKEIQGWAAGVEAHHSEVIANLALLRPGHPRAQDFEPTGHGGSDPTAINALRPDAAVLEGRRYDKAIRDAHKAIRAAADISHTHRNGVRPERQPDDPQDVWCALHLQLDAHEPRYRNELCRPCAERKYQTGDFPTLDDIRYHMRQGRWPRKPIDPTLHRPRVEVIRPQTDEDAAIALTRGQHLASLDALREGAALLEPITSTGAI